MIATVLALLAALLIGWWSIGYWRTRDAEQATSRVAGGVFSLAVGGVAVALVILQEGAVALSMVGDLFAQHAPYVAHAAVTGIGWLGFSGRLSISSTWWLVVAIGVLLVLVALDRR